MGQEASTPIDENTPPQRLESRSLEAIAKYIKDGRARRIVCMTGAGLSTAAGIPDFRSKDTGLYANLERLNLPYPEAVFDISYFRQNPEPFYALAHELYPGKYRPTLAHSFIRLLYDKGLLLKLFTQNIDCLEREAGIPGEMIVEAHGSFANQRCIECNTPYPAEQMREAVRSKRVPRCLNSTCGGLVKPDIVFFGQQLPEEFFLNRTLPAAADLCIVMGTSLMVQPFASLPQYCGEGVPRLLINLDQVGGLGTRADDVLLLCECDAGVRRLADECGWLEELEALWAQTAPKEAMEMLANGKGSAAEGAKDEEGADMQQTEGWSKDEQLIAEVEKLTKEVEETLRVSEKQRRDVVGNEKKGSEDRGEAGALEGRTGRKDEVSAEEREKQLRNGDSEKEVGLQQEEKSSEEQHRNEEDLTKGDRKEEAGNTMTTKSESGAKNEFLDQQEDKDEDKTQKSEKPVL